MFLKMGDARNIPKSTNFGYVWSSPIFRNTINTYLHTIHSTYMHTVTFTMHAQTHHAVAPKGTWACIHEDTFLTSTCGDIIWVKIQKTVRIRLPVFCSSRRLECFTMVNLTLPFKLKKSGWVRFCMIKGVSCQECHSNSVSLRVVINY